MKSRRGKSQRREEKRREEKRRRKKIKKEKVSKKKVSEERKSRRKKIQVREKVAKPSQNTVFFKWFVAPEGRKVGSLNRRVRSQLARWDMKIARRCGAKHISKSKCIKHTRSGPLLEPKTMACVRHLKRICKDAFSVASAVQETCSSELLGGPGADFLRMVAFWSLRSSGLLRWFCVTGPALRMTWHHFFVAGAVVKTDGLETSQNALVRGRQLCTQLFIFEGRLAELLRFWCCQAQKLRKSRWIAAFLILSSSKAEDVSQNSFVFKLADR